MFSSTLTTIISFVVVLSVLVSVHELGHFSMAKLFGVRVYEFAIGFPPRLFGWVRGETTYAVNVLPLGGYVRMMGENGDDADNPESFGYKPWWQRGLVLLGGPIMNVSLALVLFFITAAWLGLPAGTSNLVESVIRPSPAWSAGFHPGDQIISVDGKALQKSRIHNAIDQKSRIGTVESIVVLRNGKDVTLRVRPKTSTTTGGGYIGIGMGVLTRTYSIPDAVAQAFNQIGITIMAVPNLIHSLSQGRNPGVSGPIGIAHATGQVTMGARTYGLGTLFGFVALISASLGVFNLLPIPALDGGRIVFVLLAGIRRRNLDPQVEGMFHLIGMAVLLLLVLLVSYNDIANWAGQ